MLGDKGAHITEQDTNQVADRETALELKELLQAAADAIKGQIEKHLDTGGDRDEWYFRASTALRTKNRQIQKLARKAGQFKKIEKEGRAHTVELEFVTVASRRLDKELFESLLQEAKDEYGDNTNEGEG